MKIVTKLIVASILAWSAGAPALAGEPEGDVLSERNTYFFTPDARPIVRHQQNFDARAHRGTEAQAFAPARMSGPAPAGEVRDFGISAY